MVPTQNLVELHMSCLTSQKKEGREGGREGREGGRDGGWEAKGGEEGWEAKEGEGQGGREGME